MGFFYKISVITGVSIFLLASLAIADDCGKCQGHQAAKCGKSTDCGGCQSDNHRCDSCKPKCESNCKTGGCASKIDARHGSGSLQDLLPNQNGMILIDVDCCPKETYDLLRCISWEGYTLCCTQDDFKLLCGKGPKKCDGSCKPKKPKCRQSTCSSCT